MSGTRGSLARPPSLVRTLGLTFALVATVLASCGGGGTEGEARPAAEPVAPTGAAPEPVLPVTVDSADGSEVTVTDVSRIVPLWGNLSEIVFALGLGDRVVARDISATFPEAEDLPLVTRAHDVSAEAVLAQRPTLVLAGPDTGPPEAIGQIRAAGVPVLVVDDPTSIDDIEDRVLAVASALGVRDRGVELAAETEAEIAEVQRRIPDDVDPPTVAFLYMRGQAGVYLIAGEGSGADSMIEAAGGVDAGTAMGLTEPFTPITSEAMVQAGPEVILMTTTGLESVGGIEGLVAIPGIAQTPAGVARRIVTIEDGLLYSFSSRTPEALGQLIDQLHGSTR